MAAKNHGVILPDAQKQRTLDALAGAAFGATGQRCKHLIHTIFILFCTRLILIIGMALPVAIFVGEAQEWIPELVEKARKLTVGIMLFPTA